MAIASPPRPTQDESDALVREARARQRRRRLAVAAGIALVAALGLGVYAVFSGGKPYVKQGQGGRSSALESVPRCRAAQLRLSQGFGGAAGGSSEVIYTFRNAASRACVLRGWPSVRLKNASGKLLAVRTSHALALRPHLVELRPGQMASFGLVDSYGGYNPLCPSSRTVEIAPPGDRASLSLTSSVPDCITRSTYWTLEILPLVPGPTDHQPW